MKQLHLPITSAELKNLKAGEHVLLSGSVYTARDAAHKRLIACLKQGQPLPFDLDGSAIYYVGPCPAKPGDPVGSCGPTTSGRVDPLTPPLLEAGLKIMIGKGNRSQYVRNAMEQCGAVYLAAIGGAAAVYAAHVTSCEVIAYGDLGTEAVHRMELNDFPAIVAIDANGGTIYRD